LLPLKDDIQSPRPPVATVILIVVAIGLAVSGWHPDLDSLPWPVAALLAAVLTAGVIQLVVNVLFVWLFGRSVEGSLTAAGLLAVFFVGAVAAAGIADLFGDAPVPATGGAGAVAALIGAHVVLHPRARIICWVLIPFFITFVELPSFVLALVWLALQAVPAVGDTAGTAFPGDPGVTVGLLAGGLAFGALAAGLARAMGVARAGSGQPAY
jgi:membrane associated rhomboid family serine protease